MLSENEIQPQHFTQIFVTASGDGGETWGCPYNIINQDLSLFGFLVPTTDAVFPHTALIEDDNLAIWYQFDDEPGLNLDADEGDPITANTIGELSIRISEYVNISKPCMLVNVPEVVDPEAFELSVNPNPTKSITHVSYTVEESMDMDLIITSLTGQQLKSVPLRPNAPGTFNYELNTKDLTAGIYLVSVRTATKVATTRLMIVK